jgi:hypothetical protein
MAYRNADTRREHQKEQRRGAEGTFLLGQDRLKKLRKLAADDGVSMNEIVRRLIDAEIVKRETAGGKLNW